MFILHQTNINSLHKYVGTLMKSGVRREEKIGEICNQENEILIANEMRHQTPYFLTIWKGDGFFFAKGMHF